METERPGGIQAAIKQVIMDNHVVIGVGNKAAPKAGGTGIIYVDDIGFGHSLP